MKTTIIIPTYNRVDFTKKCIESVFAVGSKYEFEIIIVDNGSSDGTIEYLKTLVEKVKIIENAKNYGFAKACNQGAAAAKGEYLLFLNNDTIVTEKWLDVLVEELDKNPEIAVAGSKLLYPNETIQHAGVVFGEDKIPYHLYARERKEKHYVNKKRKFNAVTAACMLVRRDIFERVGGLDENFLNGYEDIDLCLKIRELGKDIIYCPESVVYHYESISQGRIDKHVENRKIFLEKWSNVIVADYKNFMLKDGTLGNFDSLKKENELIKKENEFFKQRIHHMEASKFWKIRNCYMKLKSYCGFLVKK